MPLWWKKIRQPEAHHRLLGSIEFYRRAWDGGAHWRSSEDDSKARRLKVQAQSQAGGDAAKLHGHSSKKGEKKDWPGYQAQAAYLDYVGRRHTCKANRKAFETSSQKPRNANRAAVLESKTRVDAQNQALVSRMRGQASENYWKRRESAAENKKRANECKRIIVDRSPYKAHCSTKLHQKQCTPCASAAQSHPQRELWYGKRNTRPW